MHGSADRVVPYDGSSRRDLPDIHVWLAAWAGRDGCSSAFARNHVARDVTQTLWSGCRAGTIVEGYRIRGGGHTWPGALAASGPGATTHEIDATQTLAAFFRI
jgi:polyhydroxybutyrate depolymerase